MTPDTGRKVADPPSERQLTYMDGYYGAMTDLRNRLKGRPANFGVMLVTQWMLDYGQPAPEMAASEHISEGH